jgi:hypothetical protein
MAIFGINKHDTLASVELGGTHVVSRFAFFDALDARESKKRKKITAMAIENHFGDF